MRLKQAIVSGAIANKYRNGGEPWIRLSWALGLKRLGFDVCFVEEIFCANCVDDCGATTSFQNSANLAWFRTVMAHFGLQNSCALIYENGEQFWGLTESDLLQRARNAELLINISGHLTFSPLKSLPTRKVYLDEDPGFTQVWHTSGTAGSRIEGHDFYFTLGANIGKPGCLIPTAGLDWRHTKSPAVLEHWPVVTNPCFDRFTTVASWRGPYGPVQHQGKTYGLKVHEFRKFIDLPRRSPHKFELALQIHPADHKDLEALQSNDWLVVDPRQVAHSPHAFRDYIQNSSAEFSVAQGIYVETNSGWFSDRTVRYLASGKPALVQDTGFTHHLPTGEGLIPFRTIDEAAEGAERIVRDYAHHCRAARQIAEDYFDSDKVISNLLRAIDLGSIPPHSESKSD